MFARSAFGLSPLARGTVSFAVSVMRHRRLIPARAGNSGAPSAPGARPAVYPRSRGEQRTRSRATSAAGGLSPLARGTGSVVAATISSQRFIPARAGNRVAPNSNTSPGAVYPRSRGERLHCRCVRNVVHGLSPLARGTGRLSGCAATELRFIPARAGNGDVHDLRVSVWAVYPRSRGERQILLIVFRLLYGLSPLARGTEHQLPLR